MISNVTELNRKECQCPRGQSPANIVDAVECLTTIPTDSIVVSVQGDWVNLQGTLKEQHQSEVVENVVRHLSGVRGVTNTIRIE
jgi:osmotically-inducible protein OsmY